MCENVNIKLYLQRKEVKIEMSCLVTGTCLIGSFSGSRIHLTSTYNYQICQLHRKSNDLRWTLLSFSQSSLLLIFRTRQAKVIRLHSKMHVYYLLSLLLLCINHLTPICALVTLQTIRNLTTVTNECRERITSSGDVEGVRVEIDPMVRVLGGQAVLSGDDDDGEEIEDVSPSLTSQRRLESGLI